MPNLEQGLTYVGENPYRKNSPLAGLPAQLSADRRASFSTDRRAVIAPARMKRADDTLPTPDVVGGRSHTDRSYAWPVFRETLTTRGMTGALTPGDAASLMMRTAKGVEKMLAVAFQTGQIVYEDGEVIDVWGSESPEITAPVAWDQAGGDPLSDILEAADAMTANGARPAKRLFLASDSYRALMKSQEVRELLDNRRIDLGVIKPQKAPGVDPIAMPSDVRRGQVRGGLDALTEQTYDPNLGSFAYVGELHGIEIYRDAVGLIEKGGAIMTSRSGFIAGELDCDFYLGVGFPWVGGEQIMASGAEIALYKSISPNGSQLDSYSFISLQWSNVWGAIHLDGLTTPTE